MIPNDVLQEIRRIDALSWLQEHEPDNLVRISGNKYCTMDHDSLKISDKGWYWWSRGFGGYSALDYLTKVKNLSFIEAVKAITGEMNNWKTAPTNYVKKERITEKPERKLQLPELEKYPVKAKAYLMQRGIAESVIDYCIEHSLIFETREYHNVLFVGYDKEGIARYGTMRGTYADFKGEVSGSDKRFSFSIGNDQSAQLHVFECAIDLLSFLSLEEMCGKNWEQESYLSLGGVAGGKNSRLPVALDQYLQDHLEIQKITLHLDNDMPGRDVANAILKNLRDRYMMYISQPTFGKDVNDTLLYVKNQNRRKEGRAR